MLFDKSFREEILNEIKWWIEDPEASILMQEILDKELLLRKSLISDALFISEYKVNLDHLEDVINWLSRFDYLDHPISDDDKTIVTSKQNEEVLPYLLNEGGNFILGFNNFNDSKYSIRKATIDIDGNETLLKLINLDERVNLNKFLKIQNFSKAKLNITYMNNETGTDQNSVLQYIFEDEPISIFPESEMLKIYSHFNVDKKNKEIILEKNQHIVAEHTLVLPKSYKLILKEGSSIYFKNKQGLIVNGGLKIEGSNSNPVTLNGANGIEGSWSGVLVLANKQKVDINSLKMSGGSGIFNDFKYRGAFTIHNSSIEILNSSFSYNQSEDALNLVQVTGLLDNIKIFNTPSDGLDIDFGEISINKILLENIGKDTGADAIDMSKSVVKISNSIIRNVTDKGVSVGEASLCEINNIEIYNALVGFTSKDSSRLSIENAKLSGIKLSSAMAYRKKNHHDGGYLDIRNIETTKKNYISQDKSLLLIDNILVKSKRVNIDKLYQETMLSVK